MKINPIEFLNVVIVVGLLMVLWRRRDAATQLLALFVYGSLHFSFAAIALAANDAGALLIDMHNEGGGLLARLSTLTLLSVVFSLLGRQAYAEFFSGRAREWNGGVFALLVVAALFYGYFLNCRPSDLLQLKNVASIAVMLMLVMLGYFAITNIHLLCVGNAYTWGWVGLCVLFVVDGIALYEVLMQYAWATFLESSGAQVYRASSILFNPNLYAFWASLLYLACAHGIHTYRRYRLMFVLGMVLISTAIYLSGSRSVGYLLLALLFILTMLIRGYMQWLSLLVLPLTMFSIYAVATSLQGDAGWQEIVLLGERFASAPVYLFNYVYQYVCSSTDIKASVVRMCTLATSTRAPQISLPSEIAVSIEGRFVGEARDAGWLVLYQDTGWIGLGAVVLAGTILVIRGVRIYFAQPCPASAYTLVLLFYCLLTGFVMRLQIFPVWLFVGLALTICTVYWRSARVVPDKAGD